MIMITLTLTVTIVKQIRWGEEEVTRYLFNFYRYQWYNFLIKLILFYLYNQNYMCLYTNVNASK